MKPPLPAAAAAPVATLLPEAAGRATAPGPAEAEPAAAFPLGDFMDPDNHWRGLQPGEERPSPDVAKAYEMLRIDRVDPSTSFEQDRNINNGISIFVRREWKQRYNINTGNSSLGL